MDLCYDQLASYSLILILSMLMEHLSAEVFCQCCKLLELMESCTSEMICNLRHLHNKLRCANIYQKYQPWLQESWGQHGAHLGPIWGRRVPGGPHVDPMNFAIWEDSITWYSFSQSLFGMDKSFLWLTSQAGSGKWPRSRLFNISLASFRENIYKL